MSNVPSKRAISYLVGGLTISLKATSNTPGPRTHITSMCRAWTKLGADVGVLVASTYPGLGRFAKVKVRNISGSSSAKLVFVDTIRLGIGLWTGVITFVKSVRQPRPDVIYERLAVFQSMTSFHRYKRSATRVIEANGILSREAARDRKGLKLERLAGAIEKRVLKRADMVVAVSEPLARELQAFAGLDASQILVVPNAADRDLAARPVAPTSDGPVIIGFLGSLARWHRLPGLINDMVENWDDLERAASGRPLLFRVVGEGGDRVAVEQAIASSGLGDKMQSLGPMPRGDALNEAATWSVGMAPHQASSSAEMYHSPLKLYEYAALGLVVLATPSGDADMLQKDGVPVHVYRGQNEFVSALRSAIAAAVQRTPSDISDTRSRVELLHTWEKRAATVLERSMSTAESGMR